jgi:hypothetical protein
VAEWARFDNVTGETVGAAVRTTSSSTEMRAPQDLLREDASYIKVQLSAVQPPHASWAKPADAYFRKVPAGWKLVGLERLP